MVVNEEEGEHQSAADDQAGPDVSEKVDGRTARRDRNRDLVADACLALLSEGVAEPTHEMVARRSGVSLRSVFRYWDNTDDMFEAVFQRAYDRLNAEHGVFEPSSGSFEERCSVFVDHRVARHIAAGNWGRVVRRREPLTVSRRGVLAKVQDNNVDVIRVHFDTELARFAPTEREEVVAALFVASSFESMDLAQRQLGFTEEQIAASMTRVFRSLLT